MDETATSTGPAATGIAALIRRKIGAATSGKLRRAVALTLATQVLSWSMAIGVTFYLPAYLGERNLGTLTLAVGFAATLGVFVSFGTSTVLVQQIARHPYRARELVRTSLILRTALGAAMACVGLLATWLLGYDADVRLIVVLVMVATIFGQVTETYQSALAGLQEFVRLSTATLSERLTFSAITIGLVFLKAPLWQFAAVYLLSNTLSSRRSFAAAALPPFAPMCPRRRCRRRCRPTRRRRWRRPGFPSSRRACLRRSTVTGPQRC
ncbi:MAG: oligosaccharide flippase family protein [Gemmatimonadaceae bacterium]|nr:oligosaccharide flippase family protein [Gemmatimonadaceae bacterium]